MDVSVIITTNKEEKRLGKTLEKISRYMSKKNHVYEIMIIDDNSPDNTIKIAESFGSSEIKVIKNESRIGKGGSVRIGVEKASFGNILICDADLSTSIEELEKLRKS